MTKSPLIAVSFIVGAMCSGAAGWFGMKVATSANVRTTAAARNNLNDALQVAFSGGTVMGMAVVGLALGGMGLLLLVYGHFGLVGEFSATATEPAMSKVITALTGFSLGASSIALFARVGGRHLH